ncbi:aminotransferase class V-fold PLP-dependent enzyme [Alteribacter natronophilus]|uniref:aminotransferase class V-fold PLP-dependent enzyme n=1 Tax=Alteribacter natronophilus TaxID=2583810 RepID=UPI00110EE5AA|nr:aminotransferase class V-fold PLP-dependent enzyme [Alteribacter natronophilus]TMW71184.1 aminotransferase class V-fold PLP-dependent enzyme [Alteribacter natronophilus]
MISNTLITEEDAKEWQKEFPILRDVIHVGNCSQAPQAKKVRLAIEKYLDNWLTVGMDWEYWVEEVNRSKEEFAKLINASPEEVAITSSVSLATASIIGALPFDEIKSNIVLTEADFPTIGHVSLAQAKRQGFGVDFIPVKNGEIEEADYEKYVNDNTMLTCVTSAYYQNGFKQNLKKIGEIIHQKGSIYYVDAYQDIGTSHIDVKEMDIDILTTGNLKYLLGMPGIAFIYVKKELSERLEPSITGWFGMKNPFSFEIKNLDYAPDTRRFDTGTPAILTAFAARAGMEIINKVGPKNIEERIDRLSIFTLDLMRTKGMDIASPLDIKRKGAVTAIRVPNPHDVERKLKEKQIIASARGDVIRIAPHFFTTQENLKIVVDELEDVLKV